MASSQWARFLSKNASSPERILASQSLARTLLVRRQVLDCVFCLFLAYGEGKHLAFLRDGVLHRWKRVLDLAQLCFELVQGLGI